MTPSRRKFKLRIWALALGYFAFYLPYAVLIKIVTTQLWPGIDTQISGFRLLPPVTISTALVSVGIVSLKKWWRFCSRREVFGRSVPCPTGLVVLSGLGTALIIGTTTLAFTFSGMSILLALVLMRGGVLTIAPVVDLMFRRRVRWFSWAALAFAMPAVLVALAKVDSLSLNVVGAAIIGLYLTGYVLRLPCVTRLAKTQDSDVTNRYFVEEMTIALCFLIAIPAALALIGKGEIMLALRQGFTQLLASNITFPALLIGALYAGLYYFGTLIYLDCRENTFCIPLNRGASLLAGVVGTVVMFWLFKQPPPAKSQFASAAMIVVALLFLSPLHHPQRTFKTLRTSLAALYQFLVEVFFGTLAPISSPGGQSVSAGDYLTIEKNVKPPRISEQPRIFLFVCSGNTCRSPIAAAIANAEIAFRMNVAFADLKTVNVKALSAGLAAREGMPMTPEAQEVLRSINVPVAKHAAQNLTVELADRAEMIFCMTRAHRKAIIKVIPSVSAKTFCLDDEVDIEDPIGKGLDAYFNCALRIRDLIVTRFNELGLQDAPQS